MCRARPLGSRPSCSRTATPPGTCAWRKLRPGWCSATTADPSIWQRSFRGTCGWISLKDRCTFRHHEFQYTSLVNSTRYAWTSPLAATRICLPDSSALLRHQINKYFGFSHYLACTESSWRPRSRSSWWCTAASPSSGARTRKDSPEPGIRGSDICSHRRTSKCMLHGNIGKINDN